ncbi:uncharacterized protein LOC141595284 [Silene latifolia]|uniref:uncharacterized protein LOC141595284 n=1 Tax=Silene latifolia TaxID=37657 RepID=UPI003D788990
MKEILLCKRNTDNVETVALTEECSTLLQNKTPPKLDDPGSFSIPCHIGTYLINNALCDLGASVSVLPLSLAKRLGLTKFQYIPENTRTPIILGRPFLHTAGAIIDVGARTLTFQVGGEDLVFAQPTVIPSVEPDGVPSDPSIVSHIVVDLKPPPVWEQVGGISLCYSFYRSLQVERPRRQA